MADGLRWVAVGRWVGGGQDPSWGWLHHPSWVGVPAGEMCSLCHPSGPVQILVQAPRPSCKPSTQGSTGPSQMYRLTADSKEAAGGESDLLGTAC